MPRQSASLRTRFTPTEPAALVQPARLELALAEPAVTFPTSRKIGVSSPRHWSSQSRRRSIFGGVEVDELEASSSSELVALG